MNLAQTLYKAANQPNKPRVFLQNVIEDHPLWKSADFWEEFLKCKIEFNKMISYFIRYNKRRDA